MNLNKVEKIDNNVEIRNVLISTADKSGLDEFIKNLFEINPEIRIFSTGGTFSKISESIGDKYKDNLISVSDYTGQPEMQGGLVKTLDFKIYLGLLSETYNDFHKKDLERAGAIIFDMVVVNLYPFEETIKKKGNNTEDARANIDIGGPCMLRASAKNFLRVASVCDPADYGNIIEKMRNNNGKIDYETRFRLAGKTFRHTAKYDTAIAEYLSSIAPEKAAEIYKML